MIIAPIDPNLNIVRDGLVLWLDPRFQTSYPASGSTWSDLSGNGLNATLTNGATFSSNNGGIMQLDGSNDTIIINDDASLDFTNNMTLSIWVKMNAFPNNFIGIIDKYIGNTSGYMIDIQSSTDKKPRFVIFNGANRNCIATTVMNTTDWYMITATYDGVNMKIYVNAINETTVATTANINTNSSNIQIGGDGVSTNYANANIGNVFFYNRALSSTEITHNYDIQKIRFGL